MSENRHIVHPCNKATAKKLWQKCQPARNKGELNKSIIRSIVSRKDPKRSDEEFWSHPWHSVSGFLEEHSSPWNVHKWISIWGIKSIQNREERSWVHTNNGIDRNAPPNPPWRLNKPYFSIFLPAQYVRSWVICNAGQAGLHAQSRRRGSTIPPSFSLLARGEPNDEPLLLCKMHSESDSWIMLIS